MLMIRVFKTRTAAQIWVSLRTGYDIDPSPASDGRWLTHVIRW